MDQPSSADSRLSNYRLERLLGAGGMGSVYLARDLALDRLVAIKFISPDRAGDDSARRRLIREARAAAALEHPNICGVHEVIDAPDGRACIVMQYVEGRTLADVLRDGPLDVRLALSIAADLSSALAAAHRHGIIHRDLKPQNVILTTEHHAKLLDFGVARHADSGTVASDNTTTTQLTTPGVIVGTPSYMSPEQVLQRPLDGRSDLFALGAVLFECLTGRRPFAGHSGLEQVSGVLHDEPPPVSSLRSGLNEQHDEFVHRLLAKAPEDRFSSADEVLGALRVLMPDEASARWRAHQEPRGWFATRRGRRTALAVAAVAIIVAAAGVWKWSRPKARFDAPPQALHLYDVGTEWIRRGAYSSGRRALSDAIKAAPEFVPAYVRLAEASGELDDYLSATRALLEIDALVGDAKDLAPNDRLRVDAIRALMLRRMDEAVDAYARLAQRDSRDSGALLDLGRVLEAAARPREARQKYEEAIRLRPGYATAHLRLANTLADQNDRSALKYYDLAAEIYRNESNAEGQVEVLLRRGGFLYVLGELKAARDALEESLQLATRLGLPEQAIKAELTLSSVTASEGRTGDAQAAAESAVAKALEANLETVAAEGLIGLANVLLQRSSHATEEEEKEHQKAVEEPLMKAIELADKRNAQKTRARAALQLASAKASWQKWDESLALAEHELEFLRTNGYKRYELTALTIMSRSHEGRGDYGKAREMADQVLKIATELQNEPQQADALDNMAGQSAAMGLLPDAEAFWSRAEAIHREQKDNGLLPYALTNRAEMLIRLGRAADADPLLRAVEEGAARKIDSFSGRLRRARALRALAAATTAQHEATASISRGLLEEPTAEVDSPGRLARRLLDYAEAQRRGRRASPARTWMTEKEGASVAGRELRYWELAAALAGGDAAGTLQQSIATLQWKNISSSPEVHWRIAALGASAASALGDTANAQALAAAARAQLDRLRATWPHSVDHYLARGDLQPLLRKAGLTWQN
jgi:predicted Ser/Thr protein kinase